MARVVAEVAPAYENYIEWETIITKNIGGAQRYAELSKKVGRPMPVPSIIIDGELVFDTIPGVEELRKCLDGYLEAEKK